MNFYRFIFLLIYFGAAYSLYGQNVQLYTEDFNSGPNAFNLNTDTTFGPQGWNKWVINNDYTGGAGYPPTIRQDSISGGGTIAGAPFSNYLHIHDEVVAIANNVANANYNPTNASENFAFLSDPICTKTISDVKLSFFYLCEGNADAYGEAYYSVNGGPWILTSPTKYFAQDKWKYEVIANPAFDDVEDLRIGFRWTNTNNSGPVSTSFSVDDIFVVGTYDPVTHPLNITITNLFPDPVCRGSNLIVFFEMNDTLCSGTYRFWLSDSGGTFNGPTNLGVLTIGSTHSSFVVAVNIPPGTVTDTCYRIRVDRLNPVPPITGTVSVCFTVVDCPNIITTHQPVVTMGPDTVCIRSVIDVPFNSTGVYDPNNVYSIQLSDTNGSFANPFILGSVPDPNAYPALPGSVSGLIPDNVPPGCGYFLRIVSSSPNAIGSVWGPFCLRDCDITTNKMQDIQVCINESNGAVDSIYVDIHSWNTNAQYFQGNSFKVDVHSSMTFALLNSGGLGAVFDTASGRFLITIPPLPGLLGMGLIPGLYYIRIVADNSSTPHDLLGSLVRLSIGAPSESPAVVLPTDSFICTGDVEGFTIVPYNQNSSYEWQSAQLSGGQPFTWPGNTLLINFTGFAGVLRARVREINFGCVGPWSDYGEITVLTPPDVNITGPINACIGDTLFYRVPFQDATYYEWDPSIGGTIYDTTNNEANIIWDSLGTFFITIRSLNECGLDFGFKEVTVWPYPVVEIGEDTAICNGESVILNATAGLDKYFWLRGSNILGTADSIVVAPSNTTDYHVYVENKGGCPDRDTITVAVEDQILVNEVDSLCKGHTLELNANRSGIGYLWNTGDTSQIISVDDTGLYSVQLFDPIKACVDEKKVNVFYTVCGSVFEIPNAFTPNNDGLNDRFEILGENFVLLYFRIYNRWGELIFESNDKSLGWDGTYKGEDAQGGVYTWVIQFTDELDNAYLKSGNVTLIR